MYNSLLSYLSLSLAPNFKIYFLLDIYLFSCFWWVNEEQVIEWPLNRERERKNENGIGRKWIVGIYSFSSFFFFLLFSVLFSAFLSSHYAAPVFVCFFYCNKIAFVRSVTKNNQKVIEPQFMDLLMVVVVLRTLMIHLEIYWMIMMSKLAPIRLARPRRLISAAQACALGLFVAEIEGGWTVKHQCLDRSEPVPIQWQRKRHYNR